MNTLIILVFVLGYIAIAFEQKISLDKAATALITGVLCWLLFYFSQHSNSLADEALMVHMGEIGSILFFLIGAMTIVEVIDSHNGFNIITDTFTTKSKPLLLILISFITFFLSSILDNLTTAIVMTSLCNKLLHDKKDKLWFASMVIIAANAGGAWSPLGDVTTTMLWIKGQVTALNIIHKTFLSSFFVVLIPLCIITFKLKGQKIENTKSFKNKNAESNIILFTGIAMLLFVPAFKALTHMPPFMGMLFSLGIIWLVGSVIHLNKHPDERHKYSVASALHRIDYSSILFFLGILLAVAALETSGVLKNLADYVTTNIKNIYLTGTTLGILSAIIDNVPMVAAVQGMFGLNTYPTDHVFWEFLALTTGTGGSIIIIGSAAGVAVMGIEKIGFFWYLKNISWLAFLGFAAGISVYILQQWI